MTMTKRMFLAGLCLGIALPLASQSPGPAEKGAPLFKQGSKEDSDPNMRAVAGVVSDESGAAVEGAVVKIKDTKSLKIRSYITQKDGIYRFNGVSTNVDYEIHADYKGKSSETRTLSVFDSRRQARVNLQLEPLKEKAEK